MRFMVTGKDKLDRVVERQSPGGLTLMKEMRKENMDREEGMDLAFRNIMGDLSVVQSIAATCWRMFESWMVSGM
ncbi:hypothetical protein PAAG_11141 [Paracoccidioides lutzii Pb01]|uniref:Uncharacterized protein n=1 Tax=Paracoccidioides lutzii (strain ATCC MYA-826 / Pb01) TaxID=502779 RepID=A0A0A2V7Z9_PARBA|nr:hypothetical protein PAAG_11141 [Paracoccidioides lutzii Pb01]KGQ02185.1 hypothetical protein PAAG_11141 [Paracoccidioides lutzii Pb01]